MAATNEFGDYATKSLTGPLRKSETSDAFVTPNDSADLSYVTRAIMVGSVGDLRVTLVGMTDGHYITLPNLLPGTIHPIMAKRIWQTGTDATEIVALR